MNQPPNSPSTIHLLLVTLSLLLTACTSSSNPTITFAVFGDPAEFAAYQTLVEAFEAQHPDIDVTLSHTPGQADYRQKLATAFAGQRPPDIFLLNYRRFAPYAEQAIIAPLGSYLAESTLIASDDFYPITIDSFTYQDQLWCIPQNISSLVVYYNKNLFDAAGHPYPSNNWTREEFLRAARALTQDTDNDGRPDQFGVGLTPNLFRLAPFFWQDGLDIVDDPQHPTRLTLDAPTFQWFVNLRQVEQVTPSDVDEAAMGSEDRFLNGTLAMYFNSRRGVPTYRTITRFEWDVAPLPTGQQAAGILHSDAYCMAAQTENKPAAWTFIEFANSVEGQTIVAASGRTVPSLIAVAESPAFLDPTQPPANARVYLDTIPLLGRVPLMTNWPAIEETASKEIERAFYGNASTSEAAATAQTLTESFFLDN